jgi:hypothetical protein
MKGILRFLATAGCLMLILGLVFLWNWRQAERGTRILLTFVTAAGPCVHPLKNVNISRRVISEKESATLSIVLHNESSKECGAEVSVRAPNFEPYPAETTKKVTIPPGEHNATLSWTIRPKEKGQQSVSISAGLDSAEVTIAVRTVLGLSAAQAQILGYIGSFLGPALTFPWLYDKWKKKSKSNQSRRRRKKGEVPDATA